MNARKRKALDAMARGAPLYITIGNGDLCRYPRPIGSGTILADVGRMEVSPRIVAAITKLGTRWCPEWQAVVLTENARLRARGRDVIVL